MVVCGDADDAAEPIEKKWAGRVVVHDDGDAMVVVIVLSIVPNNTWHESLNYKAGSSLRSALVPFQFFFCKTKIVYAAVKRVKSAEEKIFTLKLWE